MEIEAIAKDVVKKEDGIFYSKKNSTISYPEKGNENCMQLEKNSFWFLHRNEIILKAVTKYSYSSTFFDIGGGNGFVAKGLQDAGINVVLVEPGKAGAVNARKRGIHNVICSTLEDAHFKNESMDSAGLFDVVEHIENDQEFLKQIYTYIKKDGCIYITVPAFNFLWSNEDKDAGHFRRYKLKEIEATLQQAGFAIEYSTYIFSILPLPVFLFRTLPSKLGLNKRSQDIQKHKKEHKAGNGIINSILSKIWKWELSQIEHSKKMSIGGSCFVIGRKSL
jgi:2-polyprenyl-3-methyl-5-hydroxy-6-metoxy-1,4-benzoquinol methylase